MLAFANVDKSPLSEMTRPHLPFVSAENIENLKRTVLCKECIQSWLSQAFNIVLAENIDNFGQSGGCLTIIIAAEPKLC